jgi:hypothetical protein
MPTGIPVVNGVAADGDVRMIVDAMNSIKRLVFGLASSLLLAAGFMRAADRLDPMNNSLRFTPDNDQVGATPPCTWPCDIASETA